MNIIKYILVVLLISLVTACGTPKLDTSTDETIETSAQNIMSELSIEDQERFKKSLVGIYTIGALSSMGSNKSADEIQSSVNAKLNGKTAEEIFKLAEEISQKMKSK
jgi:adenylate cyclase